MKRSLFVTIIFIGVVLLVNPAFALSVIDVKDKTPKDNPCDKSLVPNDIYEDFKEALAKFLSGDAVKGIDKQIADETKMNKTVPVEIYVDDLDGFKKQYKDDRDGIETDKTAEELEQDAENIYNSHPAYTYTTDKKVNGVQTIKVKFFCQKDLRLRTIDNDESSGWKLYEQMLHEFIHVKIYNYDAVGVKPPFDDHDQDPKNDDQEEFFKKFKEYFDKYKNTFAAALQNEPPATELAQAETVSLEDLGIKEPRLLPTSKLYFLKEWGRGIKRLFTFGAVAKTRFELEIVNKKAAEAKIVKEKDPENAEAVAKAFENYQKAQERLKNRFESLRETSQNPNVDRLLDQLADQVVKHEKLFDELAEKAKHDAEMNSIRNMKAIVEETVIAASKKDTAANFAGKIERAFINAKGSELKHLRSVEILDRISQKASEEARLALEKVRENLLSGVQKGLKNLIEQRGVGALKETFDQLPGDDLRHLSVLEEVNQNLKFSLPHLRPEDLRLSLPHLKSEDQRAFSEMEVPEILDQVLEGLKESFKKSERDIANYAESEINYVKELLERNIHFYDKLLVEEISAGDEQKDKLFKQAEEKLQQAQQVFDQKKYGEAFGLARAAEALVREGMRKFQGLDAPEKEFTTGEPARLETELFFDMEIDGAKVGSFKTVDGLENAQEVVEYQEGTERVMHKRPGKTNYSNIILRRGNMHTPELFEWYKKVTKGVTERKNISIIIHNQAGSATARYNYFEAWPCKWKGPSLDARSGTIPVEEIVICIEPREPEKPAPAPLPQPPIETRCKIACIRYDPVCGADGKTYSCGYADAECNGVKVVYSGECRIGKPMEPVPVEPKPTEGCYCIQVYQPVCGVDGKTYGNSCAVKCAGIGVQYEGECKIEVRCPFFAPPAPDFCLNGKIISGGHDANGCQLPPRCESITKTCPLYPMPVCGEGYGSKKYIIDGCEVTKCEWTGSGLSPASSSVIEPPPPAPTDTELLQSTYLKF